MDVNYEEKCIEEYTLKTDKILFKKVFIDHDGYDDLGPKSNLYSFLVIIRRDEKIVYEIFYRYYYYDGNYLDYAPSNYYSHDDQGAYKCFSEKLPEKHKEFIYYDPSDDLYKICENVKRKRWLNNMLG